MNWKCSLLAAFAVLTINSCTQYDKPVVSLILGSNSTDWNKQIYYDVKRECFAHSDITFKFEDAVESDREQSKQIADAIVRGVDAIIINPVSASDELVPAIEKAYDSGIAVVIVGQPLNTPKYSSYVGVDNIRIGRMAATFIATKMGGKGNLMTVSLADFDASFYTDRKHAFDNTIAQFDGITVTDCPIRTWSASSAHEAIDSIAALPGTVPPDMIFAYGDDLAMGVIEAGLWPGVPVMGVDGTLSTGLPEIQKGNLFASILNLTRGADAVDAVCDIISRRPYEKNNILSPGIITADNVMSVIAGLQDVEIFKKRLDSMNSKYESMAPKMKSMVVVMTILAILVLILFVMGIRLGKGVKKGRKLSERYQALQAAHDISESSRRELEEDKKNLLEAVRDCLNNENNKEFTNPVEESVFLSKFKNYLEENLANSELSMDDIASSLNLSKAQMYRKVRAVSEMTPNELLQNMRLARADELLKSSELTIAEVAYSVGFASPSYFTRCYREKYGVPPKMKR